MLASTYRLPGACYGRPRPARGAPKDPADKLDAEGRQVLVLYSTRVWRNRRQQRPDADHLRHVLAGVCNEPPQKPWLPTTFGDFKEDKAFTFNHMPYSMW